ncbi:hypothetical protein C8J57DRAFT_1469931 [Mycena rebaudengoi]|nr:hypothetical protein C8J57DRAFT_1469931 [Mycena rebaudengoi]
MFEQASEFSPSEIKAYRNFAFTDTLSNPGNDPFFSVDNAAFWISFLVYQLYLLHHDFVTSSTRWCPEDASPKQLIAYRTYISGLIPLHSKPTWTRPKIQCLGIRRPPLLMHPLALHPRFPWPNPVPVAAFNLSHPPGLALRSMSVEVIEIHDSDSDDPGSAAIPATHSTASLGNPFAPPLSKVEIVDVSISLTSPPPAMVRDKKPEPKKKGKGNGKGKLQQLQQIAITRQEKVDHIIHSTSVPTTYDVPRTPTVLLVHLSGSVELLRALNGHIVPLDTFIRAQNHESWDGGAGHTAGNVNVAGFTSNLSEKIRCHRCLLKCNGIDTWMQELWDSVLDLNEEVAASAPGFICRVFEPPYAPPAPLYVNASDMDVQVQVDADDGQPVAPKDIDLDLNERNILAGKRKRTKSTRAVTLQLRGPPKNSCAMALSGVINSKLSTVDTLRQVNGTAIRITLSCVPPVTVTINGLKRVALTPSSPTADGLCDWASRTRTLPVYTQWGGQGGGSEEGEEKQDEEGGGRPRTQRTLSVPGVGGGWCYRRQAAAAATRGGAEREHQQNMTVLSRRTARGLSEG